MQILMDVTDNGQRVGVFSAPITTWYSLGIEVWMALESGEYVPERLPIKTMYDSKQNRQWLCMDCESPAEADHLVVEMYEWERSNMCPLKLDEILVDYRKTKAVEIDVPF